MTGIARQSAAFESTRYSRRVTKGPSVWRAAANGGCVHFFGPVANPVRLPTSPGGCGSAAFALQLLVDDGRLPVAGSPRSSVAAVGGRLFAFGGSNATGLLGSGEVYDPAAVSPVWVAAPSLPPIRTQTGEAVLGNVIYVVGGQGPGGSITTTNFAFTAPVIVEPADSDGDGLTNDADNCPDVANPDQADAAGDGIGDPK